MSGSCAVRGRSYNFLWCNIYRGYTGGYCGAEGIV